MSEPLTFWCEPCKAWTPQAVDRGSSVAYCDRCGATYECGECGDEIDRFGNCQRRSCLNYPGRQ